VRFKERLSAPSRAITRSSPLSGDSRCDFHRQRRAREEPCERWRFRRDCSWSMPAAVALTNGSPTLAQDPCWLRIRSSTPSVLPPLSREHRQPWIRHLAGFGGGLKPLSGRSTFGDGGLQSAAISYLRMHPIWPRVISGNSPSPRRLAFHDAEVRMARLAERGARTQSARDDLRPTREAGLH